MRAITSLAVVALLAGLGHGDGTVVTRTGSVGALQAFEAGALTMPVTGLADMRDRVAALGGGVVTGVGAPPQYRPKPYHEMYFTRAIYPMYRGLNGNRDFSRRGRCGNHRWCTDWPEADEHFSNVISTSLDVDVYIGENAVDLDDPVLRRFPFLYLVEPGFMTLTESQREGLRSYLLQGGFLVLDDFWGTYQYQNFVYEFEKILPEFEVVEIPMDHQIFHTIYDIDEIVQVHNWYRFDTATPWEEDGYEAWVHGIFDDNGRLLVLANAHTDIGDGMEHADDPFYPTHYSKYAFFMVMNFIAYAMAN